MLSVPLGDIAAGQTVSVTFKATVNSDMYNQTIYNTAVAEGANGIVKDESGSETGKYEDTDDGVYINKGDTAPYVENVRTSLPPRSAIRSPIPSRSATQRVRL